MVYILERTNNALIINPSTATNHLVVEGSDWLWAVAGIYTVSFFCFIFLCTFAAPYGERVFHYLFGIAALTGSIAYYVMVSDLGSVAVLTELNNDGNYDITRQIWYPRYINWFVAWPLIVIAILILSGISWATMLYAVGLTWIWVCSWLAGAFVTTTYKWGFYAFGVAAYLLLAGQLGYWGRISARLVGSDTQYTIIAFILIFLWLLYPIAWGLDEGGNKISVTAGFIFYGVLDILTVPVLGFCFMTLSRSWDYDALSLQFTQYGRAGRREEGVDPERALGANRKD
jgi:bacteriorhodopsin